MLATWSATEVAFLMVAVVQGVFTVIWALSAWLVAATRRAATHWAAWSILSAVTWIVLGVYIESPPLIGVVIGMLSVMLLQQGIRIFIERPANHLVHGIQLTIVMIAWWVGRDPGTRYIEAALNFGVLTWLHFDVARDLYLHARDRLRFRWPIVLSLPVLLGGTAYGSRALQALFQPESVLTVMTSDSALNVNGALTFVVLVLSLHATLITLVVARFVTELRRLSRHDALTDLLNRRAMEETLELQIQRSRRFGDTFTVMMLDLDHFKRINDQFGHAVGDLALKHVSSLLGGAMRDTDRLARFGGEEFVLLMANATLPQAQPLAERLRELVASTPLAHADKSVQLSVSIGIAQWHGAGEDASHLLLRADAALFQAKVQGRNRVVEAISDIAAELELT